MISQQVIPAFTLLDYGLTALALFAMIAIVWLFVKFLSNHMAKMTGVLEDLANVTRGMSEEVFRQTRATRDLSLDVEELGSAVRATRNRRRTNEKTDSNEKTETSTLE